MTEKRFKIYDKETMDTYIEDTKDLYSDGSPKTYWFMENEDFCDLFDKLNELNDENKQLKEALREELQDNGNAYYIEIFDKLFNLNYDEWDRNERYRECTDWEKVLKDKGDVE